MSLIYCEKHGYRWDSDKLEECPLCANESPISKAIDGLNLLSFSLGGRSYIVEPHAYGKTSSGEDVLRCFQVGGDQTFGWKLIQVSDMEDIEISEQHFSGPRNGYALEDRGMSKIYIRSTRRNPIRKTNHTGGTEMKPHYFEQDAPDADDMMLNMAKGQGYVPKTCLLGGMVVMAETNAGRDACAGCNGPREKCRGRAKSG